MGRGSLFGASRRGPHVGRWRILHGCPRGRGRRVLLDRTSSSRKNEVFMAGRGAESTATFRCKALYLCVRSQKGREGAKDFVDAVGVGRVFEDETKPISRELWLRALKEFENICGDEGFRRLSRYIVHPKNLGFWSVMLRGAESPRDIYKRLDESGGDQDYGWTWRLRTVGETNWTGEVCFLESDTVDDRRRIRKALSAELRAIPLLFGLHPAQVTSQVEHLTCDDGTTEEIIQTASWSVPRTTFGPGIGGSLLLGGLAFGAAEYFGFQNVDAALLGISTALLGAVTSYVLVRDLQYRSASRAQHLRILALEREAVLQKRQVKEISRPHEEPVIAGKYRLSHQLGYGAAGAVWKAKRLTDGASVAIKLLRTALAQDPRATDRLRREAQALGLSWHPHVVEVLDDGMLSSGVAFLVTELLRGETLGQRIAAQGALPPAEVAKWGVQALDALAAIHSAGVIHRDVKPNNLFLHRSPGGAERLKLIDFGVAAVSWAETRLTRSGARVGTPGYAAPEQDAGEEADHRADLFGLGQTLKEALTGVAPHPDESRDPLLPNDLPDGWAEVIQKMTAVSPSDRFSSARVAQRALAQLGGIELAKSDSQPEEIDQHAPDEDDPDESSPKVAG
jgi:eukaryotic-like serine/threonine-protein kinase